MSSPADYATGASASATLRIGCGRPSWDLRGNLTVHDATYVALAESLDVPLLTLDQRIARAPGIRCDVQVPTRG